jgi:hypothetical protein
MVRPPTRLAGAPAALAALAPIAWIGGGALALWLAFGHGFVQYDTFYALLWGSEIADGGSPDYDASLSPTPHPLASIVGVVLSPLGDGAETATLAIAFVALAAVAYLVYRLGAEWFNPAVGLLAAAIVITRQPLLDFGVRAYVDIPYLALVLAALLVETRRPRAGAPVLALLAFAGLLRPEAWLFSAAYLLYLAYGGPERARRGEAPRGRVRSALEPLAALLRGRNGLALAALAAAAPVVWMLFDLVYAGDPLYSLTGTRDTVEALGRDTGLEGLVVDGPQRLGEVLREPVLIGAALGLALSLALLRRRAVIGAAACAIALAAFSLLAIAGLAVLTRYLLPAATLLAIFCAAGVLGWLDLERGDPWRTRWAAIGGFIALLLIAFVPAQVDRLSDLRDSIAIQERLGDDLHDLADSGAFDPGCAPIAVPDERAIPFLALWLDRRPSTIVPVSDDDGTTNPGGEPLGYVLAARTREAQEFFTLDRQVQEAGGGAPATDGFHLLTSNDSWNLYASCDTGADR